MRQVADVKKWIWLFLAACVALVSLAGCQSKKQKDDQRSEVEFTVVAKEEIPEELAAEIEKNKQGEIRMAYTDGGDQYLIRGYGEQKTGGYSISVIECTENDTEVFLDTRLLGPSNEEQITKEPSYPYIVLKIEAREKEVRIQ